LHSPIQTADGSGKPEAVWCFKAKDLTGFENLSGLFSG
jgi:hypothetical protein